MSSSPALRRAFSIRLLHEAEDVVDDINWLHVAFKTVAYSYIAFILWITWQVLPLPGHWSTSASSDTMPMVYQDLQHDFHRFHGFSDCKIGARDLYSEPVPDRDGHDSHNAFGPTQKILLEAMSTGDPVGFDPPCTAKGCYYRWFSVAEICMILERFDRVVFVGDDSMQTIYNGFNILLRQDLAWGALMTWRMDERTQDQCRCGNQFARPRCSKHFVTSSNEVTKNTPARGRPYACQRPSHALLLIDSSPAPTHVRTQFQQMTVTVQPSNSKPVPIIHSLCPDTVSPDTASNSVREFLVLAHDSKRKTPLLWVGPSAAGHMEMKNRKATIARDHDVEVWRVWNMTSSGDRVKFAEGVAITQAMMVINWLSRLETS